MTVSRSLAALLAASALAGCMVGPNYPGPPHPAPLAEGAKSFNRAALAQAEAGPPAARWWTALNDPELDRLVEAALAQSPDVRAAESRSAARCTSGATSAASASALRAATRRRCSGTRSSRASANQASAARAG